MHLRKISDSVGEEYIGELVQRVRVEAEQRERSMRMQLKIKKRKKYGDKYEELSHIIWADMLRRSRRLGTGIWIFNVD